MRGEEMFGPIKRRDVIAGLGAAAGSAISWPRPARAQARPVVGLLSSLAEKVLSSQVKNLYRGLSDTGFVAGRNLRIEERWAEGQYDRLPALARELVAMKVDAIATIGGNVVVLAAKGATTTIPIVFATAADPVATGLVTSFSRPGGNLTGITWLGAALQAKYLELMNELLPRVSTVGLLVHPRGTTTPEQLRAVQEASNSIGKKIRVLSAANAAEIDAAFTTVAEERIGALIVGTDPMFNNRLEQIVTLAAHRSVPTIYFLREFVEAGGLMSYGAKLSDAFYQVGAYTGRVLKGAKPADLPVQQSTKVELVINLKTAKTLGLTIPINLLGRADEVIE